MGTAPVHYSTLYFGLECGEMPWDCRICPGSCRLLLHKFGWNNWCIHIGLHIWKLDMFNSVLWNSHWEDEERERESTLPQIEFRTKIDLNSNNTVIKKGFCDAVWSSYNFFGGNSCGFSSAFFTAAKAVDDKDFQLQLVRWRSLSRIDIRQPGILGSTRHGDQTCPNCKFSIRYSLNEYSKPTFFEVQLKSQLSITNAYK